MRSSVRLFAKKTDPRSVFGFLCLAAWLAVAMSPYSATAQQMSDVRVVIPQVREISRVASQPATTNPYYEADLGAQVSGFVQDLMVDIGDRVIAGQVLARIAVPDLRESVQAELANVAALESEFQRVAMLVERQSLTARAAEEARQRVDSARAELRRLEALNEYGVIRSPFDGIVTERNIDPGDAVFEARSPKGDDRPLMKVAAVDTIRVRTYVAEKDAVWLDVGDVANVVFDALPGQAFSGRVSRLAGVLDPATRSMATEIDIPNSEGTILPGLYGRVQIELENHPQAVVLPATAVRFDASGAYIYLVDAENRIRRRIVTVGLDDGNWLEIVSGVSDGERVIDGGIGRLRDGETVNVVP